MLLLQGDVPPEDLIFGAVVLVLLAPLVLGAGYLLGRFKNARFARAWAPLMPVLQGAEVTHDGAGAATSWLTGTYKGIEVRASEREREPGLSWR